MQIFEDMTTNEGIATPTVWTRLKSGRWDLVSQDDPTSDMIVEDESGTERRLRFVARVEKPEKVNNDTVQPLIDEAMAADSA